MRIFTALLTGLAGIITLIALVTVTLVVATTVPAIPQTINVPATLPCFPRDVALADLKSGGYVLVTGAVTYVGTFFMVVATPDGSWMALVDRGPEVGLVCALTAGENWSDPPGEPS